MPSPPKLHPPLLAGFIAIVVILLAAGCKHKGKCHDCGADSYVDWDSYEDEVYLDDDPWDDPWTDGYDSESGSDDSWDDSWDDGWDDGWDDDGGYADDWDDYSDEDF